MPDTIAGTADQLRQAAAAAVNALPTVVRLEPTLTNALQRLHAATTTKPAAEHQTAYSAADGIRLTRHGNLIDIHVDITITITQPANLTAQTVHHTLQTAVTTHHLTPGDITVTVLRLQP